MKGSSKAIQIYGCCNNYFSPSIAFIADGEGVLFNTSELTQRFAIENRLKLQRFKTICLTNGGTHDVLNGLPGVLLCNSSASDLKNGNITCTIVGSHKVKKIMESFKSHVDPLKGIDLNFIPSINFDSWTLVRSSSSKYSIYAMSHSILGSKNCQTCIQDTIPSNLCTIDNNFLNFYKDDVLKQSPERKRAKSLLCDENEERETKLNLGSSYGTAYLIQLANISGKLDMPKLNTLRLPKGAWLAELKAGRSVDVGGHHLDPSEYLIGGNRGTNMLIVGCDAPVGFLIDCAAKISSVDICFVLDLPSPGVDVTGDVWHNETRIVYIGRREGVPYDPLRTLSVVTSCLRTFEPGFFASPNTSCVPPIISCESITAANSCSKPFPTMLLDVTSPTTLPPPGTPLKWLARESEETDVFDLEMFRSCLQTEFAAVSSLSQPSISTAAASSKSWVRLLGTAGAMPSKLRGVSGALLSLGTSKRLVLVDPGEGSLPSWFSSSGTSFVEEVENLCMIIVSHAHADHNLGVFAILSRWAKQKRERLAQHTTEKENRIVLVAPAFMKEWFLLGVEQAGMSFENDVYWCPAEYLCRVQPDKRLLEIACGLGDSKDRELCELEVNECALGKPLFDVESKEKLQESLREIEHLTGVKVETRLVPHVRASFAVKMAWEDCERGIVFSGDSERSQEIEELAQNCTMLIHESTFCVDHKASALATRHSTIGDAIYVGRGANVSCLLLTHFSQRYSILDESFLSKALDEQFGLNEMDKLSMRNKTILGFDHAQIPLLREEDKERISQFARASQNLLSIMARAKIMKTNEEQSSEKYLKNKASN